jgi:hypothetical protein
MSLKDKVLITNLFIILKVKYIIYFFNFNLEVYKKLNKEYYAII